MAMNSIGASAQPYAVGPIDPNARNPEPEEDFLTLLKQVRDSLRLMAGRICPLEQWLTVTFDGKTSTVGSTQVIQVNRPYNGVLYSLTQGQINMYAGSNRNLSAPMFCFSNPLLKSEVIYFPERVDRNITTLVTGSQTAIGTIHLLSM